MLFSIRFVRLCALLSVLSLSLSFFVLTSEQMALSQTSRPRFGSQLSMISKHYTLKSTGIHSLALARPSKSAYFRFDPSGLVLGGDGKTMFTVNDKGNRFKVLRFQLPAKVSHKSVKVWVHKEFSTKKWVFPSSKHWPRWRLRLDLEGVTRCGRHLFVISEQLRKVFRIEHTTGKLTTHPINIAKYQRKTARNGRPMPRFSIDFNAGYEGIVCDVKRKRLYLIQERTPRLILVVKWPKTWVNGRALRVMDHFDLPSLSLPRKVQNISLPPDFSGGAMFGGYLYLLYRNARVIMKVDPLRHALLATASYIDIERGLYQNRKPYGLAEGLAMSAKKIWLVFDNNGHSRQGNVLDRRPVVIEMMRPSGF